MLLSVVIPAYNESRYLRATIASVHTAAAAAGLAPYEVIVSDDASTDDTARVAAGAGARVVLSGKRNIGATRNVGAAAARGRYLLFLDADTQVNPAAMAALKRVMDHGVVGGGALLQWSSPVRRFGAWSLKAWNTLSRLFDWPAGGFFFVRRDVFEAIGGFDERYFVSEELHLGSRLRRLGRLVILREPVATSPRKLHDHSAWAFAGLCLRAALSPWTFVRDRSRLGLWYAQR